MTSRTESMPPSARSCRGGLEPTRLSRGYNDVIQDMSVPGPVMVDSYLTSFNSTVAINPDKAPQGNSNNNSIRRSKIPVINEREVADGSCSNNVTDRYHKSKQSRTASRHSHGLSIMTWDEFVENPHLLNDMFSRDKNEFISHDPSKMNVFFQDCRMLQPTLGTLSSNGLSWTIYIESYAELKSVRAWLTERVSVLVVALINRNKKRQADLGERASCLIAVDPQQGGVREKLYLALSQAMNSFLRQRLFSVVIDLNHCVEHWCQDILRMRCAAEGAKLIITNGDEYQDCNDFRGNSCLGIFCYPIKLLQGAAYRVQRRVNYDDYSVDFDEERMYLCTANTKLQTYADATYSMVRKSTKKRRKNVLKSTMSTQTINGVLGTSQHRDNVSKHCDKTNAGGNAYDCDIEDLERGDEVEALDSSRTLRSNVDQIYGMSHETKNTSGTDTDTVPVPKPRSKQRTKTEISERQKTPRTESSGIEYHGMKETFTRTPKPERQRIKVDAEVDVHVYEKKADKCGAPEPCEDILSVTRKTVEENDSKISSSQDNGVFTRSSSITHTVLTTEVVNISGKDSTPGGNIPIGVFDDVPLNVTQGRAVNGDVIAPPEDATVNKSTKQERRISKMLKDIMGPGVGPPSKINHDGSSDVGGIDSVKAFKTRKKQIILAASNNRLKASRNSSETSSYCSEVNPVDLTVNRFSRNSLRRSMVARKVAEFICDTSNNNNPPGDLVTEETPLRSGKVNKIRQRFSDSDHTKLFTPRFMLEEDRNCFSDHDPGGETTDADPDVMSDTEIVTSPRLINVKNTDRTVSVDSISRATDTDLELTDCDAEDLGLGKKKPPKLRPKPVQKRGTRGQFDSRRRYLALNSLRRKTRMKREHAV